MSGSPQRRYVGIEVRHRRGCPASSGGACSCQPSYRAEAWSARDRRRLRKTFPTFAAAKAWRQDAAAAIRRGTLAAPAPKTLAEAAAEWLSGARSGAILTRSGDPYKPSAIRGYEEALRRRVLPELGKTKLSELSRVDLQRFVARLMGRSLGASTVRNTLIPVRAIYRQALTYGEVSVNPTTGLQLPAVRGRRDRIATADEAAELLAAVPDGDRAIWATAMYAGLRRGELLALRWSDIDLDAQVIHIEQAWDVKEGVIAPKSRAGVRTVPVVRLLHAQLVKQRLLSGRSSGLAFGRSPDLPFNSRALSSRAVAAWLHRGLNPITLHECRHTFASLMIAAGVNAKALSVFMGHSSITITLDRYGHLFPGSEAEAASLLDAYLGRGTKLATPPASP
jgi:integrase